MRYFGECVLILKCTVSPTFTLISVANPWMSGSPELWMSHSVDGFPGLQFSATILLAGDAHGSCRAAGALEPPLVRVCAATMAVPNTRQSNPKQIRFMGVPLRRGAHYSMPQ